MNLYIYIYTSVFRRGKVVAENYIRPFSSARAVYMRIPSSRNVGGNCFANCFMGPVSVARARARKTVISSQPRLVNNSSAPKVNYALELRLLLLPADDAAAAAAAAAVKNNGSKSLVLRLRRR